MSQLKHLRNHSHFLTLLLTTSKIQVRALFYTLSNSQVQVIEEIIVNLFHLTLPPKINSIFKRYSTLLKRILKATPNEKRVILENNYSKVYNLLLTAKTHILPLLEDETR